MFKTDSLGISLLWFTWHERLII